MVSAGNSKNWERSSFSMTLYWVPCLSHTPFDSICKLRAQPSLCPHLISPSLRGSWEKSCHVLGVYLLLNSVCWGQLRQRQTYSPFTSPTLRAGFCRHVMVLSTSLWTHGLIHSFLAWYVPGATLGIQHRHSYCPAIQTGWEKQTYKQSGDAEAAHCHKSTWRQVLLVSE